MLDGIDIRRLFSRRRILKGVHLMSTVWLIVCVGYIIVLTLRQAGLDWWVIFSLSGHSVIVMFLLLSMYLFALFRGVDKNQKIEIEHPLTSTDYYIVFYVITPLLGGLAGFFGMMGEDVTSQFALGIALGALGATFLVWVIVDPVTGLLETLLPASRKHRNQRITQARALRRQMQEDRERLLKEVLARERSTRLYWQNELRPYAERLAEILVKADRAGFRSAEQQAVEIGVDAWQKGGLSCMQELRVMTMELCKGGDKDSKVVDYIPVWWDGIGNWRSPSLG